VRRCKGYELHGADINKEIQAIRLSKATKDGELQACKAEIEAYKAKVEAHEAQIKVCVAAVQ